MGQHRLYFVIIKNYGIIKKILSDIERKSRICKPDTTLKITGEPKKCFRYGVLSMRKVQPKTVGRHKP